jgi:AcrR family transcriptional regulator
MSKVSPSTAPADPTRDKLLEAATQVFAEQGFYAATVREICSRAGANVAAVNYYFGDKAELYEEVLRRVILLAHDAAVREALNLEQPDKALRRAIRLMLGRLCSPSRPSWTMRIMMHEMAHPTPALAQVVGDIIAPNYLLFRRIIGRMIELPPDHDKTRLCAHSVIGQILHYVHARPVLAHIWPALHMTEDRLDEVAEHIADFSLGYLKRKRKASHE